MTITWRFVSKRTLITFISCFLFVYNVRNKVITVSFFYFPHSGKTNSYSTYNRPLLANLIVIIHISVVQRLHGPGIYVHQPAIDRHQFPELPQLPLGNAERFRLQDPPHPLRAGGMRQRAAIVVVTPAELGRYPGKRGGFYLTVAERAANLLEALQDRMEVWITHRSYLQRMLS